MPPQTPVHHILVLDDDEIMRDLLNALLSQEGYQVSLAGSGEDAFALLREATSPDLVLTDLHMPGLAEQALADALRERIPSTTLLLGMSGSEPSQGTRATLDGFLLKPFNASALNAAIRVAQGHDTAETPERTGLVEHERSSTLPLAEAPVLPPPLDEAIFGALAKSIPAPQLVQLYEMTLTDIAKRHARMEAAAATGDLTTLHREAHTIKGSCGFVGAGELQALAASLEAGTKPGTSTLAEIPAACLRLRSMLKSKLHTA